MRAPLDDLPDWRRRSPAAGVRARAAPARVPGRDWGSEMEPWLFERASSTPAAIAIVTGDRELTFGALADGADAVARRLVTCGATPGARVAVIGDPTVRTIEIVHAVQSLGAVLVPINTRLVRREVDALLACARPALVLHDERHAAIAPPGSIEMTRGLDGVAASSRAPARHDRPHRPALDRLHVGHHRGAQGGDAHPRRLSRERARLGGTTGHHSADPLAPVHAALSRRRPLDRPAQRDHRLRDRARGAVRRRAW